VGDATAKLDVVTGGDGTWRAPQAAAPPTVPTFSTAPLQPGQVPTVPPPTAAPPPPPKPTGPQGIFGGRYRVRAWRTPDLALTTPQILFVESTQNRNVGLQLSRYTGVSASSIYSPDPPLVGGSTSVTAVVTTLSVDGDGVVRSVPLANASISVSVDPPWLFSGGQLITNGQGRATFQLQCEAEGQGRVDLIVNSTHSFGLTFRPCVPPAPSTTTSLPDASTTSSILGGTTSTTFGSTPTTR